VRTYCLFLGHARSGHSIVGALLDAHPHIVLSDELDALRYFAAGFDRDRLLWLSVKVARDQAHRLRQKRGRGGRIYSYHVPGQFQGLTTDARVIGDSNAGGTVRALSEDPELLLRLRAAMGDIEVRFIHVIRNPFDNIATMMLRSGRSFENAFERYFENWKLIDDLRPAIGRDAILALRHEDLLEAPQETLAAACRHLGLDAPQDYLDACAGVLYGSPSRSRDSFQWTDAQRRRVEEGIARVPSLAGYSFDA
jgi:hypothetical protein